MSNGEVQWDALNPPSGAVVDTTDLAGLQPTNEGGVRRLKRISALKIFDYMKTKFGTAAQADISDIDDEFAAVESDVVDIKADIVELDTLIEPCPKDGCILDVNGEGMPEIPDNPDGVTYQNAKDWVDGVDGWTGLQSAITVDSKKLEVSYTTGINFFRASKAFTSVNTPFIVVSMIAGCDANYRLYATVGGVSDQLQWSEDYKKGDIIYKTIIISGDVTLIHLNAYKSPAIGDNFYIKDIYIGDGTYLTGAPDHSGTQNPAINTAVTPADYYNGIKLMHFNGATSNLEFDNPVIGTTGTIRFITKNFDSSNFEYLIDNRTSLSNSGLLARKSTSNIFEFFLYGATTNDYFPTGINLTDVNIVTVVVSDSLMIAYADGEFISSQAVTCNPVASQNNFFVGCELTKALFANGDLAVNYTTKQLSAAEVKSDYNNPRQYNNEPKSQTGLAYSDMVRDSNGDARANSFIGENIPTYTDNTAALAGGLVAGQFYKTSTGVLMIVY